MSGRDAKRPVGQSNALNDLELSHRGRQQGFVLFDLTVVRNVENVTRRRCRAALEYPRFAWKNAGHGTRSPDDDWFFGKSGSPSNLSILGFRLSGRLLLTPRLFRVRFSDATLCFRSYKTSVEIHPHNARQDRSEMIVSYHGVSVQHDWANVPFVVVSVFHWQATIMGPVSF